MTTSTITFHDCHRPALEDGHYSITVAHQINIAEKDVSKNISEQMLPKSLDFYMEGPRFNLDPGLIHSVFPPAGGKGDYRANLPTLVLTRSTLPWERLPYDPGDKKTVDNSAAWLFLLLIDESESSMANEINNADLSTISGFLGVTSDQLNRLPAQINYLELDPSANPSLSALIPKTLDELQYLSYVRVKDDKSEEQAVLLCNRLPQAGHGSTVYLVSLEHNYTDPNTFACKKDADGKYVLPYLYKWNFHTFDEQLYCVTEVIADNLKKMHTDLPDLAAIYDQVFDNSEDFETKLRSQAFNITDTRLITAIERAAKIPGSTFHELLSHLQGGFAPFSINPAATGDITASGSVQLNYNKLEKKADGTLPFYTSAWYRGPLAAGQITLADLPQIKRAADLFLSDGKTLDGTYAAAWELGRLTALNDVDFSTEFFKWKHEVAAARRLSTLQSNPKYPGIDHLSLADKGNPNLPLPQHVIDKFNSWKNLKGIPFRYLVPDPALLPAESIRFFHLDVNWVNAFISGAFSIGHTVSADLSGDEHGLYLKPGQPITGFLIHSFAVSAWPDFEVDVTHQNGADLPLILKDNLDVNIRMHLYYDRIAQLSFHLHPGKIHPGFLYENDQYTKSNGKVVAIIDKDSNVVDISNLKENLNATFVAQFASQIMEGTPEVIFTIGTTQG